MQATPVITVGPVDQLMHEGASFGHVWETTVYEYRASALAVAAHHAVGQVVGAAYLYVESGTVDGHAHMAIGVSQVQRQRSHAGSSPFPYSMYFSLSGSV